MNRSIVTGVVLAIVGLTLPSGASATPIVLMDQAPITSAGQTFHFDFFGVPQSAGDGTLRIDAKGDFTLNFPHLEFISWDIEGIANGTAAPDLGVIDTVFSYDQVQFHQLFTIPSLDMAAITGDGQILSVLMNAPEVNIIHSGDFVKLTLEYTPVPEPSSLLLLMSGLGLTAWRRSRRN